MRNFFFVLLILLFVPQQPDGLSQSKSKRTNPIAQEKVSSLNPKVDQANKSIDSLQQSIKSFKEETEERGEHLNLSLERANQTVSELTSLIHGFAVVYCIITICLTLLTIGFPLLTYFLAIVPNKNEVEKAITQVDEKLKEIDQRIEEPVKRLMRQHFQRVIDQAIESLASTDQELREKGVLHLLNTIHPVDFTEEQLWKIKYSLQQSRFSKDGTIGLVKILFRAKEGIYSNDFFLNVPRYAHLSEDPDIRRDTAIYLLASELPKRLESVSQLITSARNPTAAYKELIGWMSTDHQDLLIDLINYEPLNDEQKIDRNKIIESLEDSKFKRIHEGIGQSYLFKSGQKKTKGSGMPRK